MIDNLIRNHLKEFKPYTSARSEVREASLFLDANELALGSPVNVEGLALNRYPDPNQESLRAKLAARLNLTPDRIFVGSGSDEIIDLLIRLVCEPSKDSVVIAEPTYGVYRVAAEVNNIRIKSVQLDEQFHLKSESVLRAVEPSTKIIFLCSPNNPTGNLLRRDDILTVCAGTHALVVVDQAYLEFADPSGDLSNELANHPNLVILRTLSKAWGLAGIRLGYSLSNPSIVSYLLRIKAPYNINAVTSRLALDALDHSEFLRNSFDTIRRERERLRVRLKTVGGVIRIFPSDANFLLVEFDDARRTYEKLLRNGIVVRRRSEARLRNCLRITVGSPSENEMFLKVLGEAS